MGSWSQVSMAVVKFCRKEIKGRLVKLFKILNFTSRQIYCVWCCTDQHQVLAESRVQVQIWILNLGDPPSTKEKEYKKKKWEIPRSLLTITFCAVLVFCFVFCLIVGGVIVKKGSWKLSSLISNDIAEKHERKYFNSNQCLTMHLNWRSYTFMTE